MKRSFRHIAFSLAAGWVMLSCTDNRESPVSDSGQTLRIPVTFGIGPQVINDQTGGNTIGNPSRSITPADAVDEMDTPGTPPRNFWIFQYDENGKLVGSPDYIDVTVEGIPDVLPVLSSGGAPHTLVFLANLSDPDQEWSVEAATLDKLRSKFVQVRQEKDCYLSTTNGNVLYMNAVLPGIVLDGTQNLSVVFYRNTAKLTLKLSNSTPDLTIRSVQLCNVPTHIYYTDRLYTTGSEGFPLRGTTPYLDYPAETVDIAPGLARDLTWYMPRNEMGTSGSSLNSEKNRHAPLNATYIRIIAADAAGKTTAYTVYPGMNMRNDYNVKANYHHQVLVDITGTGDPYQDSRIDDRNTIDFNSANSYILNPAEGTDAQRLFTFPIIQSNKFWQGYDPANVIGPRDKWVATLIWQDIPGTDFLRFVDADGSPRTTLTGTGTNPRIRVTVKNGSAGNALVGLRRADESGNPVGEEFLWSWHLWVTDYNPVIRTYPVQKQYIYPVDQNGNAVHRYAGTTWETGIYKEKYIMDRNLGAKSTGYNPESNLNFQFGRKDPFPQNVPLYDINGTRIWFGAGNNEDPMERVSGYTSLGIAVKNPVTVYYGFSYWTTQPTTALWYGQTETGGKSIFDPCPPGWTVPLSGAWEDFRYNRNDPSSSTVLHPNRPEIGAWQNGTNYWPAHEANGTGMNIFFPVAGFRHQIGGAVMGGRTHCYLYCANDRMTLALGSSEVSVTESQPVYSYAVRCIQE